MISISGGINYVLTVNNIHLRYIVDMLLMRFAQAGLLEYWDEMADIIVKILEQRSAPTGQTSTETVRRSQLMDLIWMWSAYIIGNSIAIVVFVSLELC